MEIEREDPDVTAEVTERSIDAKTSEDFDRATELEGANISNSIMHEVHTAQSLSTAGRSSCSYSFLGSVIVNA